MNPRDAIARAEYLTDEVFGDEWFDYALAPVVTFEQMITPPPPAYLAPLPSLTAPRPFPLGGQDLEPERFPIATIRPPRLDRRRES